MSGAVIYILARPDVATLRMTAAFAGATSPVVVCDLDPRGRTPREIAGRFYGAAQRNLLLSYPYSLRCGWPIPGDAPAALREALLRAVAACPREGSA